MGGLKDVDALLAEVERRLERSFVEEVAGLEPAWPHAFALGRPSKAELLQKLEELHLLTQRLRTWEQSYGVGIAYEGRDAGGPQRVPARMVVPTINVAAELVARRKRTKELWAEALDRTRARNALLEGSFPRLDGTSRSKLLRSVDGCDELEFELLLAAGTWFSLHDATGLTSRQVPLPGIDAKWLGNKRRQVLICLLSGLSTLELRDQPKQLDFAYLDPAHLATGGRRYDSWVEGDVAPLPYEPSVVLIVENKDSYLDFPQVDGGICLFGSGWAGMAVASAMPLVHQAKHVVYWGDLDADGFQILNGYRERGVVCESILMDVPALRRYERYGTNLEKDHRTGIARERLELPHLTHAEREAYALITSSEYAGHRRIEQERIPLAAALDALRDIVQV